MSRSPTDGFQMVAISPNVPGSTARGMNGEFSRMTILSSTEAATQTPVDQDPVGHAFVKAKRKRLSKACENCHKSKRRCDGTAPCSNCYFASKQCVYLDKDGKQVPAPRSAQQQDMPMSASGAAGVGAQQGVIPARNPAVSALQTNGQIYSAQNGQRRQADGPDASAKRARAEGSSPTSSHSGSVGSPRSDDSEENPPLPELDPAMTLELINLFFTHCNPHRLIFHKPSFSAALAADQVPEYLLLAVCALAAPWSAEMRGLAKEKMPRLAGVPFFLEARRLMFDGAGHLLSPSTLATAQALCLLEMHEVAASHSWTMHYRYFDLAMQFLEGTLQVTEPDSALAAGLPPANLRNFTVERECVRRCFWLMQTMFWINGIYTYRPLRPRSVELMQQVRLPVDEASFELAKLTTQPEYLHTPAPRTKYASQFGHVCRALSLYQTLQAVIAKDDYSPAALAACRQSLDIWLASLPEHLRYSEENLQKQIAMHETSSNTGAWCFCFIHTLHPCCLLDLYEAEGTLQAQPLEWISSQLKMILKATGNRAKNSILSACTLWTYSKYFPTDPDVEEWDRQFESLWGYRVAVVAHHWRETQRRQRTQIGRTYPVEGVPQREAPPAFAVSESDSSSSARSQPSSTRSSPRTGVVSGAPSSFQRARRGSGSLPRAAQQQQQQQQQKQGPGARGLQPQQSLPSLKASGLLDSWKPPTEAFAHTLSLSRNDGSGASPGGGGGHSHSNSLSRNGSGGVPVGLNWLNGAQ